MERKEESFEFIDPKDHFSCKICKRVLNSPQICHTCGIICCKEDIKENKCPNCKEDDIAPNKSLSKKINEAKVKCKFCSFESSFQEFQETHPKTVEEHNFECIGKSMGCSFKDKKGSVSIHELECHLALSVKNSQLKKENLLLFSSIETLKTDFLSQKQEITILKQEVTVLKIVVEEIPVLKQEITIFKQENANLKKKVEEMNKFIEEQKKGMSIEEEKKKKQLIEEQKRKEEGETWNFDSLIVNVEQKKQLCEWFCKEKKKPILLFRGTKDGFTSKDFHRLCDNKGPTLTIVKSKKENIFGGFTSLNWGCVHGQYQPDPTAKLFSLIGPCGIASWSPTLRPENAICLNNNYGPIFGSGCDLLFWENGGKRCYSKCNNTYPISTGTNLDGPQTDFEIYEVEVFQI